MIKVSSGLLRGIHLRPPAGKQTRPSSERLRQATFNVLRNFRWPDAENVLDGAVVVDLFAGTGAWGIEAWSNGAAEVWFVENHALAHKCLLENTTLALASYSAQELEAPKSHVLKADVLTAYGDLPEARVIFCDPPYEQGLVEKVLGCEQRLNRLVAGGLMLCETGTKEKLAVSPPSLKHFDTKIYGDSAVHFFVKLAT